jgi:hypothetical protein
MAHTWTILFLFVGLAVLWTLWRAWTRDSVAVRLHLDRSAPGAHLMWDIANVGAAPITVTRLVIHTRKSLHAGRSALRRDSETVSLGRPQLLESRERALIPTDVDWTLLSATSIAVADADGLEHNVSRAQLRAIQAQMRLLIDRREYTASANDWLFGATNLAFGVVILGLGFFMLLWVIATG